MTPVNLAEKLSGFDAPWSPHIVATYNDNDIFLAKFEGEFVWHAHDDTDDLFLVIEGTIAVDLETGPVTLNPGELFVVPKGVQHRPRAISNTASVLLIEPTGTPNTGDPATATPKVRI